eukprot:765356-Hanusia_phi.AAC.2
MLVVITLKTSERKQQHWKTRERRQRLMIDHEVCGCEDDAESLPYGALPSLHGPALGGGIQGGGGGFPGEVKGKGGYYLRTVEHGVGTPSAPSSILAHFSLESDIRKVKP